MEGGARSDERIGGRTTRFVVNATAQRSGWPRRVRGELNLSPGAIVFTPFRESGELVHTDMAVTMTTVRLRPPWANTALLLRDADSSVRAETSVLARRRLRHALRGCGLAVHQMTSWRVPPPPAH